MDKTDEKVLVVEGVSKRFGDVAAVRDVSFSATRGTILGLLGPNGAGKTTTLRMIMGIIDPDEGTMRFSLDGGAGELNKERIGYLPEERGLYDDARVLETLVYLGELKGLSRAEAARRAGEWLSRLDLSSWANRKVESLSKGMQQKVQFAAAILHKPDLVVLDEPFSGLDPVHQDFIKDVIRGLRAERTAVVLSSHLMNQVEELTDEIVLIDHGQAVLSGSLDAIKEEHGIHVVRLRFRGDRDALAKDRRIEGLRVEGDRATFRLPRGVEPDGFVRSLPPGIVVREIAVERPPLHDIFIAAVGRDDYEAR
jgi:ABC-2 type transport system ATP-binding protein